VLLFCFGGISWSHATECGTNMQSEGILTSEGYPDPFPMTKCSTNIIAPNDKLIRLTLQEIDTYRKTSCNKKSDTIYVKGRVSGRFRTLRAWCGPDIPSDNVFISTDNTARVQFKPHSVGNAYTNTHTGFKILVEFIPMDSSTTPDQPATTPTTPTSGSTTPDQPATTPTTPTSGVECGISKYSDAGESLDADAKIIGGEEARDYEFPWQVSLFRVETGTHFCGGSILDDNTVVTAAHCTDGIVTESNLRVAVHVRNVNTRVGAHIFSVTNIARHSFVAATFENDISLIKLSGNIIFNDETRPICLPEAGQMYSHESAVISGWGTRKSIFEYEWVGLGVM